MSIINDALKKTQMRLKGNTEVKKKTAPDPAPKPQKKDQNEVAQAYEKMYKKRQEKLEAEAVAETQPRRAISITPGMPFKTKLSGFFKGILAFLFLAASLFICYRLIIKYEPVKEFVKSLKEKKRAAAIAPRPVKKHVYKPGELILNGTSLIDGRRVALINGDIYEIGDEVNGREIITINSNSAELRGEDSIITIKVR